MYLAQPRHVWPRVPTQPLPPAPFSSLPPLLVPSDCGLWIQSCFFEFYLPSSTPRVVQHGFFPSPSLGTLINSHPFTLLTVHHLVVWLHVVRGHMGTKPIPAPKRQRWPSLAKIPASAGSIIHWLKIGKNYIAVGINKVIFRHAEMFFPDTVPKQYCMTIVYSVSTLI